MIITRALSVAMILTGLMYSSLLDHTLPLGLVSMLGDDGFVVFNIAMILCGLALFFNTSLILIWLIPIYIFVLSTIQLTFNDITHTAFVFYSALVTHTIYIAFKDRQTFKYLTARRLMIVFYLSMSLVLLVDPQGAGMALFYSAIDFWFRGRIDPIFFYQAIYLICFIGLILIESIPQMPRGRVITQAMILPFLTHGITFTFIGIDSGVFAFAPMLLIVCALWWVLTWEYAYG